MYLKNTVKSVCQWVTITKPTSEYTQDEHDFFDKYIHNLLEMGKERNVVIDYAEDENEITVQVTPEDIWVNFQCSAGWAEEWYSYYLAWNRK